MTTAISEDLRARRSEIVKQHIDAENRHDPDGVVASFHQPSYDTGSPLVAQTTAVSGVIATPPRVPVRVS
jgi:hypothetical protein